MSQGSLLGHQKSQNKLTAAPVLKQDDVKHPVELPKGNLHPVLVSHRSLWGHQKSQDKLTAAPVLKQDDVKHTVVYDLLMFKLKLYSYKMFPG